MARAAMVVPRFRRRRWGPSINDNTLSTLLYPNEEFEEVRLRGFDTVHLNQVQEPERR